jgi:ABC-type cobalamin/Fe3+-siderophores transport system ATPase subunit
VKAIRGDELSFAYNGDDVLHRLSIAAQPGQVLAIIGPNGVGKTTLLRLLAQTLAPREGHVYLGERWPICRSALWRATWPWPPKRTPPPR